MAASLAVNPFHRLPDELLLAVYQLLPPPATAALAQTNRRLHGIAADALRWRRRCLETWRYWAAAHDLPARAAAPPLTVAWRALHDARRAADDETQAGFEALLATQRGRLHRIEEVAARAYDAKDLLLRARDATPDGAVDVLARRFFADAVLGRIHRTAAVDIWTRLQRDGNAVPLEQALGAYDLFLLSARHGDLAAIAREFDRLAQAVKGANIYIWASRSVRQKAVAVAEYLRAQHLVGNPDSDEYHNLRNSFLSLALFEEPHTSLPLQSVAIYCAVARRLGLDAQPSNYPQHVHAVIRAPAGLTLDGEARRGVPPAVAAAEPERMYMDPWNTADEVPAARLRDALRQIGAPTPQIPGLLAETSTLEITRRTGRNIMNSVQTTLGRRGGPSAAAPQPPAPLLDYEAAIYAFMWTLMLLGDASAGFSGAALARGREVGPSLLQQMQIHFPEDVGLVESTLLPLCSHSASASAPASPTSSEGQAAAEGQEDEHMRALAQALARLREEDLAPIAPRRRDEEAAREAAVRYRVGQAFVHVRYGYQGFVTGWDPTCAMPEEWIENMGVDELPRGRGQPFYHVMAPDKSARYVAEENIRPLTQEPDAPLRAMAGRFFKRWDPAVGRYVSNLKEQYPDD